MALRKERLSSSFFKSSFIVTYRVQLIVRPVGRNSSSKPVPWSYVTCTFLMAPRGKAMQIWGECENSCSDHDEKGPVTGWNVGSDILKPKANLHCNFTVIQVKFFNLILWHHCAYGPVRVYVQKTTFIQNVSLTRFVWMSICYICLWHIRILHKRSLQT